MRKLYFIICSIMLVSFLGAENYKQVSGLKAFYRNGQTFLSWDGVEHYGEIKSEDVREGGISQPCFLRLFASKKRIEGSKTNILTYNVYRYSEKITPENISKAEKAGTVSPLSVYYYFGLGLEWKEDNRKDKTVFRHCFEPEKTLEDFKEVFVSTIKDAGKYFHKALKKKD